MNKSRLNILTVHHFSGLGGAERSLLDLIYYFIRKENIHLHIITPAGELQKELPEEVQYKRIPSLSSSGNPRSLILLLGLIITYSITTLFHCYQQNINRLYVSSFRSLLIVPPTRILLGIPLVYHLRDSLRSRFLPILLKRYASRIICVSEFIHKQITMHVPAQYCRIIYNGLKNDYESLEMAEEVRTVGYAGQFVAWKRVELLIDAFEQVRNLYPNVRLRIAGNAHFQKDDAYEQELIARCQNNESIEFVGWQEDIQKFFQEIDLLVLPSENEPFGRVIVEAMMVGIPVIGVNSGAIPEIIDHGQTGLVCGNTSEEIAPAMEQMICIRELRKRCTENGKVVSQKRFSLERYGQQIYEYLLDGDEFSADQSRLSS